MVIDIKIFKALRKGQRSAQEAVYRLLFSEAFKVAMRYASCEADAQHILNQAFLKAFTRINDFKGNQDNFFGWLKRILVNQALDELKKNSFKKTFVPLDDLDHEAIYDPLTNNHSYDNLVDLIQKLPTTAACVFNLFAIDGFSHKEIAEKLDISEDNSRYHLHSARNQLKQWIFKMEKL